MPRAVPKPPPGLSDPARRLWLASNPEGGYRHGRININHVPARGGHRIPMFDRARAESAALFGHQASRLAERESFEHRFSDDA